LGELARTFDGMLDRLQAAFDRQRRFTADASHELRTPLAILTLESERVLEGKRSPDEYRRALELVRSESGFMAHLVEEMLTLARMDSGQVTLKREALDLSDIAVDAVERFLPLAARSGIRLETGDLPELGVEGDRTALGQMAGNLIDNALKYTPPGSGQWVRVETGERIEQNQPLAWLRVSDSGPGISAEALPRLYERFYRADEARSRNPDDNDEVPGSGLGLSIVQRIAELHGGSVSARNLPQGGAAFEIVLPRR
jgi:signal transduction histidine kinase